MSKYAKTARSICDLLLFIALCASIFMLQRLFKPFKRGFFCGDESLGYPLKASTINLVMLLVMTLAIPLLVIIAVELFKQLPGGGGSAEKRHNAVGCGCGCRMGFRLLQCYKQIGYFLFGLAMSFFAAQLSKNCIGRLRPHFFAVCQPSMADGSTCADIQNFGKYIDTYTCTNPEATHFNLQQLNQSFPSAHASLAFYAMVYLAIYLQAVLSTRVSKLLKHLLQFLFVMFAWYVALTRITDYWHHWSDVLAGTVLGVTFAVLEAVYVADLFAFKRYNRNGNGGGGGGGGSNGNALGTKSQVKSQISPKNSAKSSSAIAVSASTTAVAPALPAYTFGTLPYLPHPAQAQYATTYHNYGYVP